MLRQPDILSEIQQSLAVSELRGTPIVARMKNAKQGMTYGEKHVQGCNP